MGLAGNQNWLAIYRLVIEPCVGGPPARMTRQAAFIPICCVLQLNERKR
jgi:hypothetical protein